MGCSLGVILYSLAVLTHVAWMGSIGVRCMFGTKVEEEIPADYALDDEPAADGRCAALDRAARDPRRQLLRLHPGAARSERAGRRARSRCAGAISRRRRSPHGAWSRVQYPPAWTYFWSCVWFLQELLIFAHRGAGLLEAARRRLGAAVLRALHRHGRRLHGGLSLDGDRRRAAADLSVRAVRRVRAGGEPALLPGLSPRQSDLRAASPVRSWVRSTASPTAYLLALWGSMCAARWSGAMHGDLRTADGASALVRGLALGYIGAGGR